MKDSQNIRTEIPFDFYEFEKMIKEHTKDMKKQIKNNLRTPKKVIVYNTNDNSLGFRYEY